MTKSPFEVPTIHRFLPVLLYQTVFLEKDLVSLISSGTTLRHYSPASYLLSHISYYEIRSLLLKYSGFGGVDGEDEILNQRHLPLPSKFYHVDVKCFSQLISN